MNKRSWRSAILHSVVAVVMLLIAWAHSRYIGSYDFLSGSRPRWILLYLCSLITSAYALGLPDVPLGTSRARLWRALLVVLTSAVFISLIQLALGSPLLPRFVVFWTSLFAVPWYALSSALSDDVWQRNFSQDRAFALVSKEEYSALSSELQSTSVERPVSIVGWEAPPEFGTTDPPSESEIDVIVMNRSAMANDSIIDWAARLHARGVRVRSLSLFYEQWLGKLPISELERVSLMFDIGELHRQLYARQKRILDFVAGVVLCFVLVVTTPVIGLLDVVGNRGTLLFRQQRVGRAGKTFTIYKFRTMKPSATQSWTLENDERVGRVGRWLRKSHLDELPQAVNLLKGDLSLVGPRPEQPNYVATLSEQIPFYDVRHTIRPGITGWAQVKLAYVSSVDDTREKLQYDFYYLRRQSSIFDAVIVLRTIRSILRRDGR